MASSSRLPHEGGRATELTTSARHLVATGVDLMNTAATTITFSTEAFATLADMASNIDELFRLTEALGKARNDSLTRGCVELIAVVEAKMLGNDLAEQKPETASSERKLRSASATEDDKRLARLTLNASQCKPTDIASSRMAEALGKEIILPDDLAVAKILERVLQHAYEIEMYYNMGAEQHGGLIAWAASLVLEIVVNARHDYQDSVSLDIGNDVLELIQCSYCRRRSGNVVQYAKDMGGKSVKPVDLSTVFKAHDFLKASKDADARKRLSLALEQHAVAAQTPIVPMTNEPFADATLAVTKRPTVFMKIRTALTDFTNGSYSADSDRGKLAIHIRRQLQEAGRENPFSYKTSIAQFIEFFLKRDEPYLMEDISGFLRKLPCMLPDEKPEDYWLRLNAVLSKIFENAAFNGGKLIDGPLLHTIFLAGLPSVLRRNAHRELDARDQTFLPGAGPSSPEKSVPTFISEKELRLVVEREFDKLDRSSASLGTFGTGSGGGGKQKHSPDAKRPGADNMRRMFGNNISFDKKGAVHGWKGDPLSKSSPAYKARQGTWQSMLPKDVPPESYKSGAFKTLKNNRKMHFERGNGKSFQPRLCHMEMAALSDPSVDTADIPAGTLFCTRCYSETGRSYTGQEHSSADRARCPIASSN